MLCFKEPSVDLTFSGPGESNCKMLRSPYKEYQRMQRKIEGDSSSGDERSEQDYRQLRRVKGNYCCFRPDAFVKEAEASGDNDVAETGLRDKSTKTTVEQLVRRLSQAEREIVALKRYQSPRRCRSHERCEVLQRDLLTWRNEHEKRINSQIVRWQLTEGRRIYNELENTRKVYDNIQRHLETLERRSTKSYVDFRRQIDVWEKRLKDDVVSLHESNLMELREQLRAWFEMHNAINSPSARKEKCDLYKLADDAAVQKQEQSRRSIKSGMVTLHENNAEFLRRIEHFIRFEVQRQRDDLVKRVDRKIAELWSAFEDFRHNFHLDRDYRRHNYVQTDNDKVESIITEDTSDFTGQESMKSYLDTDFEDKRVLRNRSVQPVNSIAETAHRFHN